MKHGNASRAVGIIMGSDSDWQTMAPAALELNRFGVPYEARVVSAHRTPDDLFEYAHAAEERGLALIIAGAGGAAHLPGMTAAKTMVPVIGVPVAATPLQGLDALLSIMQMPAGIGVATVGIGPAGAKAAASFALRSLAVSDPALRAERNLLPAETAPSASPAKAVLLGRSDAEVEILRHAETYLAKLEIPHEIVRADPQESDNPLERRLADLAAGGVAAFIVASVDGIDLACAVAKSTALPALAVPVVTSPIVSIDAFLRPFREMPPGLATFAVGKPGAINAALFAATIVSGPGTTVWQRLHQMRDEQAERVRRMELGHG